MGRPRRRDRVKNPGWTTNRHSMRDPCHIAWHVHRRGWPGWRTLLPLNPIDDVAAATRRLAATGTETTQMQQMLFVLVGARVRSEIGLAISCGAVTHSA